MSKILTIQPPVITPIHRRHRQYLGNGSGTITDFSDIEFPPGIETRQS
jgi:hypothetical protein